VILLENFNECNLSPAKEGSLKKKEKQKKKERKRKEQGLKSKRGETSNEEAPCFKRRKKRGRNLQAVRKDSIERKKERKSYFPIVQNLMCGLIHTHTSFVFALPSIP
jgi:hypothetical protein